MQVHIQKNAAISLHQQLFTQISLQIASGVLTEGEKLPSVRALSQRLGIHYNTCLAVYKELATLGLVETKQGSGVQVSRLTAQTVPSVLEGMELHQMTKYFIQLARQRGYTLEAIIAAFTVIREELEKQPSPLYCVDVHADILPLFQAELEQFLQQPVQALDFTQLETVPEAAGACFFVNRYHYKRLKAQLGQETQIIVFDVGTAQMELEKIRGLPEGAFVAIISHSQVILQMGETLISSTRGDALLVRSVLVSEGEEEIERVLNHAALILCDVLCADDLRLKTRKPLIVSKLIPDSELEAIQSQLRLLSSPTMSPD